MLDDSGEPGETGSEGLVRLEAFTIERQALLLQSDLPESKVDVVYLQGR